MTPELLIPTVLFSVLLLFIFVFFFLLVMSRKQIAVLNESVAANDKKITELKSSLLSSLSTTTSPLKSEVKEARSGFISLNKKIIELTEKLDLLETQQANVQVIDSESKLYSRAVKMVDLGADIEEIIAECEIPRAEAELLMSLHRAEK